MLGEGWFRRVVPVTALAVGLVALLAVLVPGVRHQVALSASHEPQQYVQLAFARTGGGTVVTCAGSHGRVRIAFDVTSHVDQPRRVAYEVTVAGRQRRGSVALDPGRTVRVAAAVPTPHGRYVERVALPTEGRELLAHCPGSRS